MKRCAVALIVISLAATMSIAADNEMSLPPTAIAHKDVTYVDRLSGPVKLDLFLPADVKQPPLVIYIHGGGWRMGGRAEWPHMNFLVGQGYAVANLSYRLSQVAKFPAQRDDCLAALDYLVAHATEYGFDPTRIAIAGESAGGHLASLVGMERSAASTTQPSTGRIHAVIDLFGPTDLVAMRREGKLKDSFDTLFGGPLEEHLQLAQDASPLNHVDKDNPPFLIFHGTADPLVPIAQSEHFAQALQKAGVDVTLITVDKAGHASPEFWTMTQRDKMLAFLERSLK